MYVFILHVIKVQLFWLAREFIKCSKAFSFVFVVLSSLFSHSIALFYIMRIITPPIGKRDGQAILAEIPTAEKEEYRNVA